MTLFIHHPHCSPPPQKAQGKRKKEKIQLTERNIILQPRRPLRHGLRVIPRRPPRDLSINGDVVVVRGALPGADRGGGVGAEEGFVGDGGGGEVDVSFDGFVGGGVGEGVVVERGCCCWHCGDGGGFDEGGNYWVLVSTMGFILDGWMDGWMDGWIWLDVRWWMSWGGEGG